MLFAAVDTATNPNEYYPLATVNIIHGNIMPYKLRQMKAEWKESEREKKSSPLY